MRENDEDFVYTTHDIAAYYGLSYTTVWRWVRDGVIVGNKRRIYKDMRAVWTFTAQELVRVKEVIEKQDGRLNAGLRRRIHQARQVKQSQDVTQPQEE